MLSIIFDINKEPINNNMIILLVACVSAGVFPPRVCLYKCVCVCECQCVSVSECVSVCE